MALKFGTLCLDGAITSPGSAYDGHSDIQIRDSVPGHELTWLEIPHTKSLIAQTALITNISWHQLRDLKLIEGKPTEVDGEIYLLRLPWSGPTSGLVTAKPGLPPDDTVSFCWGQTMLIKMKNGIPRQECQILGPEGWSSLPPATVRPDLGFRPILDRGIRR